MSNKETINIKIFLKIFLMLTLFVLMNATQGVYADTESEIETEPVETQQDTLTHEELTQIKNLINNAKAGKVENVDIHHAKIFVSKDSKDRKQLYIQLHDSVGGVIGHIHVKGGSGGFKEVPIGLMPSSSWKSHIKLNKGISGIEHESIDKGGADTTYKKSHFKIKDGDYSALTNKKSLAKGRINASDADHTKVLVTKNLAGDETHVHLGHYNAKGNLVGTETHFEGAANPADYHKDVLTNIKEYGGGKKVNIADLGIVGEIKAEFKNIAKMDDSQVEKAQKVRTNLIKELPKTKSTEVTTLNSISLYTTEEAKSKADTLVKDLAKERTARKGNTIVSEIKEISNSIGEERGTAFKEEVLEKVKTNLGNLLNGTGNLSVAEKTTLNNLKIVPEAIGVNTNLNLLINAAIPTVDVGAVGSAGKISRAVDVLAAAGVSVDAFKAEVLSKVDGKLEGVLTKSSTGIGSKDNAEVTMLIKTAVAAGRSESDTKAFVLDKAEKSIGNVGAVGSAGKITRAVDVLTAAGGAVAAFKTKVAKEADTGFVSLLGGSGALSKADKTTLNNLKTAAIAAGGDVKANLLSKAEGAIGKVDVAGSAGKITRAVDVLEVLGGNVAALKTKVRSEAYTGFDKVLGGSGNLSAADKTTLNNLNTAAIAAGGDVKANLLSKAEGAIGNVGAAGSAGKISRAVDVLAAAGVSVDAFKAEVLSKVDGKLEGVLAKSSTGIGSKDNAEVTMLIKTAVAAGRSESDTKAFVLDKAEKSIGNVGAVGSAGKITRAVDVLIAAGGDVAAFKTKVAKEADTGFVSLLGGSGALSKADKTTLNNLKTAAIAVGRSEANVEEFVLKEAKSKMSDAVINFDSVERNRLKNILQATGIDEAPLEAVALSTARTTLSYIFTDIKKVSSDRSINEVKNKLSKLEALGISGIDATAFKTKADNAVNKIFANTDPTKVKVMKGELKNLRNLGIPGVDSAAFKTKADNAVNKIFANTDPTKVKAMKGELKNLRNLGIPGVDSAAFKTKADNALNKIFANTDPTKVKAIKGELKNLRNLGIPGVDSAAFKTKADNAVNKIFANTDPTKVKEMKAELKNLRGLGISGINASAFKTRAQNDVNNILNKEIGKTGADVGKLKVQLNNLIKISGLKTTDIRQQVIDKGLTIANATTLSGANVATLKTEYNNLRSVLKDPKAFDSSISSKLTKEATSLNKIGITRDDSQIKNAQVKLNNLRQVFGDKSELKNIVLLTEADKRQEITKFGQERNWKVLRSTKNPSGGDELIYEDQRSKRLIIATLPLGSKDIKIKRDIENKQPILPKPKPKTFANKLKEILDRFVGKGKKLTEKDKESLEVEEREPDREELDKAAAVKVKKANYKAEMEKKTN